MLLFVAGSGQSIRKRMVGERVQADWRDFGGYRRRRFICRKAIEEQRPDGAVLGLYPIIFIVMTTWPAPRVRHGCMAGSVVGCHTFRRGGDRSMNGLESGITSTLAKRCWI
jgi:hypothetical protein